MPNEAKPAIIEPPPRLDKTAAVRSRPGARRTRSTKATVATQAKPATQKVPAPKQAISSRDFTPAIVLGSSLRFECAAPRTSTESTPTSRPSRRRQAPPAIVVPTTLQKQAASESTATSTPQASKNTSSDDKPDLKGNVQSRRNSTLSAQAPAFKSKNPKPISPAKLRTPSTPTRDKPQGGRDSKTSQTPRDDKFEATIRRVVMQHLNILVDGPTKGTMLDNRADSLSSSGTALPPRFDLPEPPMSACSTTSAPLCFEDANAQPANLYINGLPAHTTDDHLLALASRFGQVKSHKAMINKETGLCKGFGFVLYETHDEARSAMLELARLGLQPSWARESFNSQLRRMADLQSANIYLSNLPKDMGSEGLERLVAPHHILSQRILTDANGASRGVGFVRLRDRALAEECIARLNGKVLPGQVIPLQVRFADSEAQKQLKQANHAAKKAVHGTPPQMQSFSNPALSSATGLGFTLYDPYSPVLNLAPASSGFSPLSLASPGMGIFGLQPGSPLIPVGSVPGYSQSVPTYANFGTPSAGFPTLAGSGFSSEFSPSSFTNLSSIYSPVSPYSVGSGITSAATSPGTLHPSGSASPSELPHGGLLPKSKSSRSLPNSRFVPPELAQQHAMALMSSWQAQDALRTFNAATTLQSRLHSPSTATDPGATVISPSDLKSIPSSGPLDAAHVKAADQRTTAPTTTSA